ncbi:hypothetical protein L7F22_008173 [Adiantum nelumboides]|nr:hypothetical protein [Adiantum nelumboides]
MYRISPAVADEDAPAVLVNGHFDSAIGSPGAGDCASCVATMLEAVRLIIDTDWVPPSPIIFLFNGAEELFMVRLSIWGNLCYSGLWLRDNDGTAEILRDIDGMAEILRGKSTCSDSDRKSGNMLFGDNLVDGVLESGICYTRLLLWTRVVIEALQASSLFGPKPLASYSRS